MSPQSVQEQLKPLQQDLWKIKWYVKNFLSARAKAAGKRFEYHNSGSTTEYFYRHEVPGLMLGITKRLDPIEMLLKLLEEGLLHDIVNISIDSIDLAPIAQLVLQTRDFFIDLQFHTMCVATPRSYHRHLDLGRAEEHFEKALRKIAGVERREGYGRCLVPQRCKARLIELGEKVGVEYADKGAVQETDESCVQDVPASSTLAVMQSIILGVQGC